MSRKKTPRETLESLEEETVEEQRRQKCDNASFADESLGGAFGKPQDRGRFGDLSRGGRPRGKDRGWAAEPEQKRQTSGHTPKMWKWFEAAAAAPKTLPVSRNISEGKPLGKRARNQKIKKFNPAAKGRLGGGFASYVRIKGRMVYCDFSDRYDGYDRKIHNSRIGSLRDESYSGNKFGDDSSHGNNDWKEHSLPAMDDNHREDSSFPGSFRQAAPDGNVWRRTGRRGRQSYPHPVDRDGDRPRQRPDWHDLEPLFKRVLEVIDSVLRKDERYAFVQRYLVGATYDEIAQTSRPKLSGRAQAYKLVERARKKLEARIGKRIPNPFC